MSDAGGRVGTRCEESTTYLSTRAIVAIAACCGVAVGNLYIANPILPLLGNAFEVDGSRAGIVVTIGQIGYTIGLLFVVPLGDVLRRQRLLGVLITIAGVSALMCASTNGLASLAAATSALCVCSVASQVLIPLLVSQVPPERRGRALVMNRSALVCGVALSRVVYGTIGDHLGWRSAYVAAGVLTLVVGWSAIGTITKDGARPSLPYGQLLRSSARLLVEVPRLRWAIGIQIPLFAAFNFVWVTLALLLTGPRYGLSVATAGLFGLVALVNLLISPILGRLLDRRGSRFVQGWGSVVLVLSATVMLFSTLHIEVVVAGLMLMAIGQQSVGAANQSRVLAERPDAMSRINSLYVGGNFIGGAMASALGLVIFEQWGWNGITLAALAASVSTAALCFLESAHDRPERETTTVTERG